MSLFLLRLKRVVIMFIFAWRRLPADHCLFQAFGACAVPVLPAGLLFIVPSDTYLHPHHQLCIHHPPVSR